MVGITGEKKTMIHKIITFIVLFAFGILTVSSSTSSDINAHIELVTPVDELAIGEMVELRCVIDEDPGDCTITWQYLDDEVGYWQSMDIVGETCCFILDDMNINYYYRVMITY